MRAIRFASHLLRASEGSSLTLERLVIDGNGKQVEANSAMIYNSGAMALGNGAVIQNNNNQVKHSAYGGGIFFSKVYTTTL